MKRPIPTLRTDEKAENFVAKADLSDYDLSSGQVVRFDMWSKDKAVSLRLPQSSRMRFAERPSASPYQRFIRMAIESALMKADRK